MGKEIWKDITDFRGFYQVSNLGNVRSLDRDILMSNKAKYRRSGQIMKPIINSWGYPCVNLRMNGKKYFKLIHRLLAIEFLPNPNNKPCINHINGIKTDNRTENLEWCTHSENNKHALSVGLRKNPSHIYKVGSDNERSKSVDFFDVYGNKMGSYDSIRIASQKVGVSPVAIGAACRNKHGLASGFQWRYSDEIKGKDFIGRAKNRILLMFSKNGEYIKTFDSPIEAERCTGIDKGNISKCAHGKSTSAGGYIWTYL